MRKRLIAGAVAGTLVLGAAGVTVAFAEGGSSTPSAAPSTAPSPRPTPDAQARQAQREAKIQDELKKLVADGTLTQAQADKVASTLAQSDAGGPGRGPGGFAGRQGPGAGGIGGLIQPELQAAAQALGLTTDQLQTQLRSGSTLAQIAKKQGKDVNALVSAVTAAAKSQLDAAVKAGKLTQDQATKIEGDLQKRITDLVNNGFPKAAPNGRNWGRTPGGGPGFGRGGSNGSTPAPGATGGASGSSSSFSPA